jgi:acyl-CoA synthetase (AMP-forming)/AMP-acid ligase II
VLPQSSHLSDPAGAVSCGSSDEYEKALIKGVIEAKGKSVTTIQTPFFDELYAPLENFERLPPMEHPSLEEICIIIHSSGSTNFPKPIPLSHAGLLTWMRSPWYTDHDLCGQRFSLQPAPPFHGMGFIYACSFPFSTGMYTADFLVNVLIDHSLFAGASAAAFPPQEPPIVPTPDKVLASWKATKVTYGNGPPHNYIVNCRLLFDVWYVR